MWIHRMRRMLILRYCWSCSLLSLFQIHLISAVRQMLSLILFFSLRFEKIISDPIKSPGKKRTRIQKLCLNLKNQTNSCLQNKSDLESDSLSITEKIMRHPWIQPQKLSKSKSTPQILWLNFDSNIQLYSYPDCHHFPSQIIIWTQFLYRNPK